MNSARAATRDGLSSRAPKSIAVTPALHPVGKLGGAWQVRIVSERHSGLRGHSTLFLEGVIENLGWGVEFIRHLNTVA
jgi:hypothetical protein